MKKRARPRPRAKRRRGARVVAAAPVTAAELRQLRKEIERRATPARWNPDPEEVQKSVAQLVLTIVEFLRRLMERQAIRRMEEGTLTPAETEALGLALMRLERTVRDLARRFRLSPDDLTLDLGPLGRLI